MEVRAVDVTSSIGNLPVQLNFSTKFHHTGKSAFSRLAEHTIPVNASDANAVQKCQVM